MQGQEAIEHRGEDVQPTRRPNLLVEAQGYVEASAEPAGPGARTAQSRNARGARARCDTQQGADRGARFGSLAAVIEAQHLAQGVGRRLAAHDAQMSEREMRDQPPESALLQGHAQRRCRGGQAGETGDGSGSFHQPKHRPAAAERQRGRQIAVATQRVDREDAVALAIRIEAGIVWQQEDFGAAHAASSLAAGGAIEPAYRPFRSLAGVATRQPMERLPRPELATRKAFAYPFDGPDLQARRAAHVGLDTILDTRVIERNRLAALLEEIDDGRAPEGEAACLDGPFEFRHRAVEIDEDVHTVAGRDERLGVEPAEIDEQELLARG